MSGSCTSLVGGRDAETWVNQWSVKLCIPVAQHCHKGLFSQKPNLRILHHHLMNKCCSHQTSNPSFPEFGSQKIRLHVVRSCKIITCCQCSRRQACPKSLQLESPEPHPRCWEASSQAASFHCLPSAAISELGLQVRTAVETPLQD